MSDPLSVIKSQVADSKYNDAIIFFIFFSRFEFALKRSGYYFYSKKLKSICADWEEFGKWFDFSEKTLEESESIEYLTSSPPKKQVRAAGGIDIRWQSDNYSGPNDVKRILALVRRIRNNLFHGGKFPFSSGEDTARNENLIKHGIIILSGCLKRNSSLRDNFMTFE